MVHEEIKIIADCFKTVSLRYQRQLGSANNLENYLIYVDNSTDNLNNLVQAYIYECQNLSLIGSSDLQSHDKAACLAVAIKNNPFFIVTDRLGFMSYTSINSFFAIDVALKFCETNLEKFEQGSFDQIFDEYDELSYSKKLLVDILENKRVYPCDINNSFKLQLNLLADFINFKKIKIKKLS